MMRPEADPVDPSNDLDAAQWAGPTRAHDVDAVTEAAAQPSAVAAATPDDRPTLADFIDELRLRAAAPVETVEAWMTLSAALLERLEKCALDFERESGRLIHRRSHVGVLVYPATDDDANSVNDFFVQRLSLRLVDLDVRSLGGLSDAEVERNLATLTDPTAHIVALRGLGPDLDPRVTDAIEWADIDVLVLGYADSASSLGPTVKRRLKHKIDLQQPAGSGIRWGSRSGAPGFF
jgi:hypothetical protein